MNAIVKVQPLTSETLCELLDKIAQESSKNAKQALVSQHITDPLFNEVCALAYDPFRVFGVLPDKDAQGTGELYFDETDALDVLYKLEKRELTGNAARDAVRSQLGQLSKKSGDLFIRILRKDLRAGFGDNTINKACAANAIEALIPVFPYQRCSLPKDTDLSKWPWERGVISQEKADGMFTNTTHLKSGPLFSSRQGSPFPVDAFTDLATEVQKILRADLQYHGEMLVERDGTVLPREIGNGVLNSVLKGGSFAENERPVLVLWDFIPLSAVKAKGKFEAKYLDRFKLLFSMLMNKDLTHKSKMIRIIPTKFVRSLDEAYEHYGQLLRQGKEGTVIKHPDAFWRDGTSKEQIKLKLEADCDLEVVAIHEGKPGSKNEGRAGALQCTTSCRNLIVDVAVKNEKMRDEVDAAPNDWIGRVITVRANQILNPSPSNTYHSLFLPRMVDDHYRTDKTEADSLERVQQQFENAIKGVKA